MMCANGCRGRGRFGLNLSFVMGAAVIAGVSARDAEAGPNRALQSPEAQNPLVFSQNIAEARVLFIDPIRNTRVIDFQPTELLPEHCSAADAETRCVLIGGHHSVIDDRDYVEFSAVQFPSLKSNIARVSLAQPRQVIWNLQELDFTGVQSNGACTRACGDPGPVPVACAPGEVHEVAIVDEDPDAQWVDLVLADLLNSRIERVHLDYSNGNGCGTVQWALDTSNPDWPQGHALPNGLQVLQEPEGEFLVTTFHTEDADVQWSGGRIALWDMSSGQPAYLWSFPDADVEDPYLNTVHHGLVQWDPVTGKRFLLYGHSLGLSPVYGQGAAGTFGIAALDDIYSPPDYMGDWNLPRSYNKLNFPRELEILSDGTFFGVEAGCYLEPPDHGPCPAAVYFFRPSTLPSSSLDGYWTRNQDHMNVVRLSESAVTREVTCGLKMLFEADYVPVSEQGQELRNAAAQGGAVCTP